MWKINSLGRTGLSISKLVDIAFQLTQLKAGRMAKHKGLKADIMFNGHKRPHNWKGLSAYVMQDDALIGSLTVRENLIFAALLKVFSL